MALEDLGAGPGVDFFAITKSDTAGFTKRCRAIYVGGAGDVAAVSADGSVVTFSSVPAGTLLPIRCVRINSTNTTATNMVGIA